MISGIFRIVREKGKRIDTGPTIGGMWTVERYEYMFNGEKVIVNLEDEGWTLRLFYKDLVAEESGSKPFTIIRGNLEYLKELADIH